MIENYTFVSVVITGFLCIAHATVLFIVRPFKIVGYNIAAVSNSFFLTVFYFLMELFDNEDLMSGQNFLITARVLAAWVCLCFIISSLIIQIGLVASIINDFRKPKNSIANK